MGYYKHGFRVQSRWNGSEHRQACEHDEKIDWLNRQLYWDPELDTIIFGIAEPHGSVFGGCPPDARCRAYHTRRVTTFDDQVRTIKMVSEPWSLLTNGHFWYDFPALVHVKIIMPTHGI